VLEIATVLWRISYKDTTLRYRHQTDNWQYYHDA